MNAVGKLGSYISQGVYTVSGTFHPFGGAIDIIVVQQEDGSFKSSPWYVRFGKFQGVLKTKQNVVRISVNDVEAGFTMFLDGKGEAFFLRDAEAGEAELASSPPTSGDEIEGMAKNGPYENIHSFEVDGGRDGIANISSQMSSRKSTFFGFMFGRKSIKENDKSGDMGRVSSLERAEIAADLLEMKWSTSMISSNLKVNNAQVNILNNDDMNVYVADEDHHVTLLPKDHLLCDENLNSHSEKMDDSLGTQMPSRYYSEIKKDDDPSCLGVKEEIKNACTEENYGEQNSEIVLGNKNLIGVQICDLGNAEAEVDHTLMKTRLIENFDETVSHENVQLCTMEVADSSHRNESISEVVEVQSIDTDAKNPGSASFHDDTSQSHPGSGMDVLSGIPSFENRKINNASFIYCETRDTANIKLNTSDENCPEHMTLLFGGIEPSNSGPLSDVSSVSPVTSPSKSAASSVIGVSNVCLEHNLEASNSKTSNSLVSEKSQHGSYINDPMEILYENALYTESDHILKSEQILHALPCNPDGAIVVEPLHEKETVQKFNFVGCSTDLREQKASGNLSFSSSICSDTCDSADVAESHNVSVHPSSCNSINVYQNTETVDAFVNMTWSFSLEGANIDGDTSSMPIEATQYNIQYSKSSDDVQFPFSGGEDFSTEEIGTKLLNIEKVAITNTPTDTGESSEAEQDLLIKKHKLPPSGSSYHTLSPSSPIIIPGCNPCHGETSLSSTSLPIIRSHIKELERYYVHQSLSWSPNSVAVKHELDAHIIEDYSSLELKAEPQRDCINREKSTGTDPAISAKNEEQEGLSLHKNVLFEGTGTHAAQQVSDAEKGKLSDPLGMTPVDESVKKYGTSRSLAASRGSWNLWPFFNRSKTISNSKSTPVGKMEMADDLAFRSTGNMTLESSAPKEKGSKKLQSLTPTTEELASLNLKEGKNVVKFNFSTPMLGLQQVDARIYLWKWDTQIVISDVDGTITKSDVLGQFMPLMGVDWSQTGVTHLFSAIKENGYQLLFLSARAISQAHLTRQFLFNLKQDGKALPDGPVFLSPDGLFPSLYREVIRRAPHEFKISCLEVIKSLFPPRCSPFYAGFGNRDTDEISYLKVGVPPGKVFIINPKGQIAVNRVANTRSYASLHDLVNGVFPAVSSFEQEDYNSWNYWKLPLHEVDI
ncbi:phosphatidate phosphatase PAH2-like isoform X1 [Zingiber officinale]|uniref:phosphatidate phosphatase PAH2-like isoform X1 n=1 Tax=Zingiber officinale TaxID=94328 RepID=UPI001C4B624E|nr:phosphatidate phosphatase PAH2-like isoform X1 [Zingiber officinale]XP_042390334.1 phosphatidate phosphatase PAH2-like isoform X1 [Zingiber officinale]